MELLPEVFWYIRSLILSEYTLLFPGLPFFRSSLQQYILKHKSELGIPDDMTIDFNDRTSPFYAIATYTNPNSNTIL